VTQDDPRRAAEGPGRPRRAHLCRERLLFVIVGLPRIPEGERRDLNLSSAAARHRVLAPASVRGIFGGGFPMNALRAGRGARVAALG